jgi:hypothetical protein
LVGLGCTSRIDRISSVSCVSSVSSVSSVSIASHNTVVTFNFRRELNIGQLVVSCGPLRQVHVCKRVEDLLILFSVAGVLEGCYNSVTTVSHGCYKHVTRMLQRWYKSVSASKIFLSYAVLQGCYKGVTKVLQGRYKHVCERVTDKLVLCSKRVCE